MTKSKRTSLKLLICILAMLMLTMLLVACNTNSYDHFDHLVTFVYNKGNLEGEAETQHLGVMNNSLVSIRPGYSNGFKQATIIGYYLTGWYLPAELDEEGNPVKDENTGFYLTGDEFDFENTRVTSDITLIGNFEKMPVITFINRADNKPIGGENGTIARNPGREVSEPSDALKPTLKDHTFLGKYYTSLTGKEEFTWPYKLETDTNVYVEFLEGTWNLVSTETQFKTAMLTGSNIYLQNDLDFKSQSTMWALGTYSGEINGNNHTIKNVYRSHEGSRSNTSNFGGIFGTLGATANIHDINFENIYVSFRRVDTTWTPTDVSVGVLASAAEAGAKIKNVKLSGIFSYDDVDGGVTGSKWIGSDKTNPTDIVNCTYENTVKTLDGIWSLVHTADDLVSAMRNGTNIYLLNNIDMKSIDAWARNNYNAEFNGNGFEISNLSRNINIVAGRTTNLGGVFGSLGANAKVYDVVIKDINVRIDIASSLNPSDIAVGLFAGNASEGATVSNVTITGKLAYTSRSEGATLNKFIGTNNGDIIDCNYEEVIVAVQ